MQIKIQYKQEIGKTWKIICAKQVMSPLLMSSKMSPESVNSCSISCLHTARIHRLRTHLWRHRQSRHHLLRAYDLSNLANFLFAIFCYNLRFAYHFYLNSSKILISDFPILISDFPFDIGLPLWYQTSPPQIEF